MFTFRPSPSIPRSHNYIQTSLSISVRTFLVALIIVEQTRKMRMFESDSLVSDTLSSIRRA